MTTTELIKIDPYMTKLPYMLHARIEQEGDKIVRLDFKALHNRVIK